jgi:hypothetical protein
MNAHRIPLRRLRFTDAARFESVHAAEFTAYKLLIPVAPVIMGIRFGRSSSVG